MPNHTLEILRDLAILERIITTVETAKDMPAGTVLGEIKGTKIAGTKVKITLTKE